MNITRTGVILKPNAARVLYRPLNLVGAERPLRIISRVLALSEMEVDQTLSEVLKDFKNRHQRLLDYFMMRYEVVRHHVPTSQQLSENRKLLIGAFFSHEYSLEAAALFNPSIVPHPDQSGLESGVLRFVLSLRATGEGHISSIVFRTGTISPSGVVSLDIPSRFVTTPAHVPAASYNKELFWTQLLDLGLVDNIAESIFKSLAPNFTSDELVREIEFLHGHANHRNTEFDRTSGRLINLAKSNYEVVFSEDQPISERVIFPNSPNESNGIEDARFVQFTDDDGTKTYVATYTAYDGRVTIPQLLETPDFRRFRISTLNGQEVQNKGMALFPRRIDGKYVMLSRQDGENNYLMYSHDLHFWHKKIPLLKPTYRWEFLQIGNCGSPIETEAGWLVISHGVGPMRKYSIGAFLLDLKDPSKVIGRLKEPLLSPDENEREGYVPNVVYSCGSLVHNGILIVPYAMSDSASSFATVPLKDLLGAMETVKA